MVLWICTSCKTQYAVGLLRCPRCRAFEYMEEGSIVPKSTTGGPSSVVAGPGEVGYVAPDDTAAEQALADDGISDAPAGEDAQEASAGPDAGSEEPAGAEPSRPASAAAKADWVTYQTGRGLDAETADGMTKKELQAWEPTAPGDLGAELTITAKAEVTRGDGPGE